MHISPRLVEGLYERRGDIGKATRLGMHTISKFAKPFRQVAYFRGDNEYARVSHDDKGVDFLLVSLESRRGNTMIILPKTLQILASAGKMTVIRPGLPALAMTSGAQNRANYAECDLIPELG